MKKTLKYLFIPITIASLIITNGPSYAIDSFYVGNDIFFFDANSTDSVCNTSGASLNNNAGSSEVQTAIANFLTTTNFSGNGDKPMNAVQMAAIMGNMQAESGFRTDAGIDKGSSHKGIIQWSEGRWSQILETKTDLINQLNFLKTELDRSDYTKNLSTFWQLSNPEDIDKAAYQIARHYEVAIIGDNVSSDYIDDNSATSGIQGWQNRKNFARDMLAKFGNLAGFTCNGMTKSQIESYIETYENSDGTQLDSANCNGYKSNETDYQSKNILANCVAVIKYFVKNNIKDDSGVTKSFSANGKDVVRALISNGFVDGGNIPQPYAVFSLDIGNEYGHTGLVLGIEGDIVYTFEENCDQKLRKDGNPNSGLREHSLSEMSKYTFAYPPQGSLINL